MIITENILAELVAQIPEIRINDDVCRQPNFHWGDRHELVKYLEIKSEEAYPLVWLLLGVENHREDGMICRRDCEIIIATRETDKSLLNTQRYLKSFDTVLNPVLKYLIEGLNSFTKTKIVNDQWSIERRPDYTESYYKNDNDNYTIDLWDALKLLCELEFYGNKCSNTIKWKD